LSQYKLMLQDALRRSVAAIDATGVVPLERWDLAEQEATLGAAPIRRVSHGSFLLFLPFY
jgi:hypothetical protein